MNYKITVNTPDFANHFKSLNLAWLTKYFVVEAIDEDILSHPEEIITQGGFIFYLSNIQSVLGCCALKHHGNDTYELTKMAVTDSHQGKGLGKLLMDACLEQFHAINGKSLYLETNSSLKAAINLYEKYNFTAQDCPFETPYKRADYFMKWGKT